jgi:hypothetical protein
VHVNASGRFLRLLHLRAGRYRVCAEYTGAPGYSPSKSGYGMLFLRGR